MERCLKGQFALGKGLGVWLKSRHLIPRARLSTHKSEFGVLSDCIVLPALGNDQLSHQLLRSSWEVSTKSSLA